MRIAGKNVDLPKYDMNIVLAIEKLQDREEEFHRGDRKASELFNDYFDFLQLVLGDEVEKVANGTTPQDADYQQVSLAVLEIINEYEAPIERRRNEINIAKIKSQFNDPTISKILEASALIKND